MANEGVHKGSQGEAGGGGVEVWVGRGRGGEGVRKVRGRDKIGQWVRRKGN